MSVVFSFNMLPGPNGIHKLNLVLSNKIHELRGWVDGHATHKLAGVFIDLLNVLGPYYLHATAFVASTPDLSGNR